MSANVGIAKCLIDHIFENCLINSTLAKCSTYEFITLHLFTFLLQGSSYENFSPVSFATP